MTPRRATSGSPERLGIRATARRLGRSEGSLRRAIRRGTVDLPVDGRLDPEAVGAQLANGTDPSRRSTGRRPAGGHAQEILKQRSRLLTLQADERDGLLVSVSDVREAAFALGRKVRDRILQVPDRLAAEFDWEPIVTLRLQAALREVLADLSQETNGGGNP